MKSIQTETLELDFYISKSKYHYGHQIEKYPEKPWNWYSISSNPNITMEDIEKYPNKPWNWISISRNPNITMDMIEKYPNKTWEWRFILENSNITMEFIEKYHNKIDFERLSKNKFTF